MRSQALGLMARNAKPGRQHEGLLRSADDEIQTPGIDVERHGADAGDGVDDKQRRRGLHDFAHGANVVGRSGGAFRRLDKDALHVGIRGQGCRDRGGFHHRSVGRGQDQWLQTERPGQLHPTLAELLRRCTR